MTLSINGGDPIRTQPFPQWPFHDDKEESALIEVLNSGVWGTLGPRVQELATSFASFAGVAHSLPVFNGTVALEAALRALGIGAGDEVIVPPYTFVATVSSVLMVGGTPVFADIDSRTNCIDPGSIEAVISDRTRAIIPVHIAGLPADMDAIMAIAEKHRLAVIEDAAQAHGASWRGKQVGSIGNAGTFSFQLSKNITAGEGGMITTNSGELADACWSIHHCGRRRSGAWYEHERAGTNFRMTEWQAAILLCQIDRAAAQLQIRERRAAELDRLLAEVPGVQLFERDERVTGHAHHLYMFKFKSEEFSGVTKEHFIKALVAEGIPASSGYVELQKQALFNDPQVRRVLSRPIDYQSLELPEAERACRETVWLPQNVLLGDEEDINQVAAAIKKIQQYRAELV